MCLFGSLGSSLCQAGPFILMHGLASRGSWALEGGLSNTGFSCSTACAVFPGQGSNLVSPELAGEFLPTIPPGMSPSLFLTKIFSVDLKELRNRSTYAIE